MQIGVILKKTTKLIKMKNLILVFLFVSSLTFKGYSQKYDAEVGNDGKEKEKVFTIVEKMPEFPGGRDGMLNYLRKNLVYPEKSKKEGVEGKVIVNFTINKKGEVIDVKIKQSVSEDIDATAVKLVEGMPKWKPGTQEGIPVLVSFNLPLNFTLPKENQ